ncbi:MAG: riboflavin synthase [Bdellovibrionaceae bacterium]|nr:riboflavin synthase [Pseudobdellovibrionaceae bacterium]
MFSGIVEAQTQIIRTQSDQNANSKTIRIFVNKPFTFDDLKNGDSICTNGVCLTVEAFTQDSIQFCLGAETLAVLGDTFFQWSQHGLNLERSLKLGDRIHGHLVTGHIDGLGKVAQTYQDGECWQIVVQVPEDIKKFFWKKGSICMNGVSLTVNDVQDDLISVCLIPETMAVTNLTQIPVGSFMNIESDYLAKAYFQLKVK